MKPNRWAAAMMALGCGAALTAQEPVLAWEATKKFSYNIERVGVTSVTASSWTVKVIFSVTNPAPTAAFPDTFWDIKNALPVKSGSLRVLVGWDATELTNTGSRGNLNPVSTAASSVGAALPVSINALTAGQVCTVALCPELGATPVAGRYFVTTTVAPMGVVTSGIAAMEGRPICPLTGPVVPGCPVVAGVATAANIPVKSVVKEFSFTGGPVTERRKIVDIANCKKCHDGGKHGDTVVPRLSLHGANRNEELKLCVICHNANQTDIPYRTSGAEVSIDFKGMVHGIHAGGFRKTPLQIVGFQGTPYDFSTVRFPSELRNCNKCHVNGSYALPISAKALGSTVDTRSTQATLTALRTVDVDPSNDVKITPTAAACSGCHDGAEVRTHMIRTGGASFGTYTGSGVVEKCVNCHGPGKKEDVRRAHELSR